MEVIFNYDLLLMKIKITYLILSPLVICYFRLILIFDLDHFLCDLPYLCLPDTGGGVFDLFTAKGDNKIGRSHVSKKV